MNANLKAVPVPRMTSTPPSAKPDPRGEAAFPAAPSLPAARSARPRRRDPRIIAMMERGKINAEPLITAHYPLDGIAEGFQRVADRTNWV